MRLGKVLVVLSWAIFCDWLFFVWPLTSYWRRYYHLERLHGDSNALYSNQLCIITMWVRCANENCPLPIWQWMQIIRNPLINVTCLTSCYLLIKKPISEKTGPVSFIPFNSCHIGWPDVCHSFSIFSHCHWGS